MKIFSGIQPSGVVHIGNFLGAMQNWAKLQNENEAIFCIVDYHAITVNYSKEELKERIISTAKDIIASGVDPQKANIFLQSDIKEHTELAWILNTITTMGELQRMTQYKEKSQKHEERVGLFDYPVLMAADILLYKTDGVPVGEDQIQHVELARDLAKRFNNRFGETFPIPKSLVTETKRIGSLAGEGKMFKSDAPYTYIALNDDSETIKRKILSATTDDGKQKEISNGTKNLLFLLEVFAGKEVGEKFHKEREQGTIKYSEMKPVLADAIIKKLEPLQKKKSEISDDEIKKILQEGAKKLRPIAQKTIQGVKEKMGLKI